MFGFIKSILSDFYIKNKRLIEIFYPVFVLGILFIVFRICLLIKDLSSKIERLTETLEKKQELLDLALHKIQEYKIAKEILLKKYAH